MPSMLSFWQAFTDQDKEFYAWYEQTRDLRQE